MDANEYNFNRHQENAQQKVAFIDNWFLTASLGSFGLSFAFIKNLGHDVNLIFLMYIAWICFVITTISVLVDNISLIYRSYNTMTVINREKAKGNSNIDYKVIDSMPAFKKIECFKNVTWPKIQKKAEIVSYVSFFIALVCSVIFAISNV